MSSDNLVTVAFQRSAERFHDPIFEEKRRIPGPGDYAVRTSLMGANGDLTPGCECTHPTSSASGKHRCGPKEPRIEKKDVKIKRIKFNCVMD